MKDMRRIFQQLSIDNKARARPPLINAVKNEATIYIYDIIDAWWGVSAEDVIKALDSISGTDVTMHINSPGGDVFEARAIVSGMRNSGKNITTVVDGLAASSASWIATAGNTVQIADGAFMMIHNSWSFAFGNASELTHTANLLEKIDGTIANEYAKKTGGELEAIVQAMNEETWFTSDEAMAAGYVDEVLDAEQGASNSARWNVSAFDKAPKALTEKINQQDDANEQRARAARNRRMEMLLQGV